MQLTVGYICHYMVKIQHASIIDALGLGIRADQGASVSGAIQPIDAPVASANPMR